MHRVDLYKPVTFHNLPLRLYQKMDDQVVYYLTLEQYGSLVDHYDGNWTVLSQFDAPANSGEHKQVIRQL